MTLHHNHGGSDMWHTHPDNEDHEGGPHGFGPDGFAGGAVYDWQGRYAYASIQMTHEQYLAIYRFLDEMFPPASNEDSAPDWTHLKMRVICGQFLDADASDL